MSSHLEYAGISIDGSPGATRSLVDRLRAARVQLAVVTGVVPEPGENDPDEEQELEGTFTSDPPSDPIG